MHRRSDAETFLRRYDGKSTSVETRFYAKEPGLRAARKFGWVTSEPAVVKGWRHTLTDAGKTALAAVIEAGASTLAAESGLSKSDHKKKPPQPGS